MSYASLLRLAGGFWVGSGLCQARPGNGRAAWMSRCGHVVFKRNRQSRSSSVPTGVGKGVKGGAYFVTSISFMWGVASKNGTSLLPFNLFTILNLALLCAAPL